MEEEDEDAITEEEKTMSNHVDHKTLQPGEPITFKQVMDVENEPDQELPTTQQNGEPHFQHSPFETRGKPQPKKEQPDSEPRALIPDVRTVIPVGGINIPVGKTQENVPPAESAYPFNTPTEVTAPLQEPQLKSTSDKSETLMRTPVDGESEPRVPHEDSRVPHEDSRVPRDVGTPRDEGDEPRAVQPEKLEGQTPPSSTDAQPRKKTPTSPAQEIRFNIPFSGVDEPYVILDTQERSPEAIYEHDFPPEVKSTPETQARTPGLVQQGKHRAADGGQSAIIIV
jgi:hypothetical protein